MLYNCDICNKRHETIAHVEVLRPLILDDLDRRVETILSKFFLVDKSFVLTRATFSISILDTKERIHFIVWVQLDHNDFINKTENLVGSEMNINGRIYDPIPMYLDAMDLPITLKYEFNESEHTFPRIQFLESESKLSKDINNGISFNDIKAFSQLIEHPNKAPS